LGTIIQEIKWFQPDLVAGASKGGAYVVELWQLGFWRGPTLLLNAHPSCDDLPRDVSVVLAHGANDENYPINRKNLECLMATGTPNRCFLYYSANSGELPSGGFTRFGDGHNMESLLLRDCLPRLVDAALAPEGPEVHMVRTWRHQRSRERQEAERWLGLHFYWLSNRWTSRSRNGRDPDVLFDVIQGSEEFQRVFAVFEAEPVQTPEYITESYFLNVRRIQRVENGSQRDGSFMPYCENVLQSFAEQGIELEAGVHTFWAFHGADPTATKSIVTSQITGFQPLTSGLHGIIWGHGTYFARDPQYVIHHGFCQPPDSNGHQHMLMCLVMMGMPCLGDPQHRGLLPFRQKRHRYNSAVDCLSSPEIFVLPHQGAAYPAYLITFVQG